MLCHSHRKEKKNTNPCTRILDDHWASRQDLPLFVWLLIPYCTTLVLFKHWRSTVFICVFKKHVALALWNNLFGINQSRFHPFVHKNGSPNLTCGSSQQEGGLKLTFQKQGLPLKRALDSEEVPQAQQQQYLARLHDLQSASDTGLADITKPQCSFQNGTHKKGDWPLLFSITTAKRQQSLLQRFISGAFSTFRSCWHDETEWCSG